MLPLIPIMAGAQVLSGIFSFLAGSDANARAQALQDQNLQNFINIAIPDPEQQKLVLQQFVNQGTINPALEQAIQQSPTEFNKIFTNAKLKAQQNTALDTLSNIGQQGGLRLQDRATLADATNKSSGQAVGDRNAISADMARRGIAGSGLDVAARLASQQDQADRDSNSSLKIASDAQSRALEAIMKSGELAGDMSKQDYTQQSDRASAADTINRFNAANLQNVQNQNVANANEAQYYNLGQKQKTADMNTNLNNQQEAYNKSLLQQQYDNQIKKAQGMSGIYNNQGNLAQQQGQNTSNLFTNIGKTGAETAQSYSWEDYLDGYYKKQKDLAAMAKTGQQQPTNVNVS